MNALRKLIVRQAIWIVATTAFLPHAAAEEPLAGEVGEDGFGRHADIFRPGEKRSWGPEQVVGPPDTPRAGDSITAWASLGQDDREEWLELTYDKAVRPVEIHVHETFCPGALVRVTAATETGMEAVLWKGEDPTPRDAGMGVSKVKVTAGMKTNRIRIHLDSKGVPGWNEIDAVGIVDEEGKTHWAARCTASSTYATGPEPKLVVDGEKALERIRELEAEIERLKKELEATQANPAP